MKPYYKNDLTTIYNSDCLEVMDYLIEKGINVDAIITDPPYGMDYQCGSRIEKYEKLKNDDNLLFLPKFIELAYNILKDDSPMIVFCSWHNVDTFKIELEKRFNIKNMLIWSKGGGGLGDLESSYMPTYEIAFLLNKGKYKLNGKRESDVINAKKDGVNDLHPTQKPLDIIIPFIEKLTKKNDLILDSFSGSFTTSVACEQLERKNIGIEIEKKYCDIGINRLNKLQMRMDI
jgi:site-specific DNA-methyltransferase (adenine-specific)